MDVTFLINGQDFAPVLSTYSVTHEPECEDEYQTRGGKIVKIGERERTHILFSLFPASDWNLSDARALRRLPLIVRFTDPDFGTIREMEFKQESVRTWKYGIHSVTGENYYLVKEMRLVAVEVDKDANYSA